MTRRKTLSLLYPGMGSGRWMRAAVETAAGDLASLCRWQWQHAAVSPVPLTAAPRKPRPG
jgi:hypothetical protein